MVPNEKQSLNMYVFKIIIIRHNAFKFEKQQIVQWEETENIE